MPVSLSVEIKDAEVKKLLARIQARVKHLKPAMKLIGEVVHTSIKENFLSQGRPRRWKSLSPVTIAIRRKKGKWPGRMLFRSGRLMRSVNYRPEDDRVTIGTKLDYAEMHQTGARRGAYGKVTANIKAHIRKVKRQWVRPHWRSTQTGRQGVYGHWRKAHRASVPAHTRQVTVPWGDVPARPFMMVQNEDWGDITDALTEFITKPA